jgi:hypothetical protein
MSRLYRDDRKQNLSGITMHLYQALALPSLAASTAKRLELLRSVFGRLFADENFVTLLRAESLTTVPAYLAPPLEKARGNREVF